MSKEKTKLITREYIEALSDIEPNCFETDREEQWFNTGLRYGLQTADFGLSKLPQIFKDECLSNNNDTNIASESLLYTGDTLASVDNNPKSPWISVEDDLPSNHEDMHQMSGSLLYTDDVLVLAGNMVLISRRLVTCMMFDDSTGKWKWNTPFHVKHWMRIPKLKE